jgi:hypothetical protein
MTTPFDIPAIVIPKMTKEKFIELLRAEMPKCYMPTSKKDRFVSKPEYVSASSRENMIIAAASHGPFPGYFKFGNAHYTQQEIPGLYASFPFDKLIVVADLETEEAWVVTYVDSAPVIHEWTDEQALAINPYDLDAAFGQF